MGDRRGEARFEIVGRLVGTMETREAMPLRNIGRGGMLLRSRVPLIVGTVRSVVLTLKGGEGEIQARVCHSRTAMDPEGRVTYLVGFEFLGLPSTLEDEIDRWVDTFDGSAARQPEA